MLPIMHAKENRILFMVTMFIVIKRIYVVYYLSETISTRQRSSGPRVKSSLTIPS